MPHSNTLEGFLNRCHELGLSLSSEKNFSRGAFATSIAISILFSPTLNEACGLNETGVKLYQAVQTLNLALEYSSLNTINTYALSILAQATITLSSGIGMREYFNYAVCASSGAALVYGSSLALLSTPSTLYHYFKGRARFRNNT